MRGYLALGLSVIVAAGGWAQLLESGSLYGDDGPTVPFPSFTDPVFVLVIVTPSAILVSIIVDIVVGAFGGPNRALAIVGGVFLLSPVIGLVIAIAGTILPVPV